MSLERRDIYRDGVWCIQDMETDKYKLLKNGSQAATPWASQSKYAKYMVYFMVVLVACFIVKRAAFKLIDYRDKKRQVQSAEANVSVFDKVVALNRLVSYRKLPSVMCEYFGLPSSLGNTLIVSATLLYVLCFTFIPKSWYRVCQGFGSPALAVRAGLEATAMIPFIIVLSGKYNVISSMTGIGYEKLNVYHRWLSMICYILAWIHILPFYVQALREGGAERVKYLQRNEKLYMNGIPPTVFLTWLCFASYTSIRRWWYELFVHMHWICGVGFCASLYIHVYPELGSQKYLYATLVLWVTQILWRIFTKTALTPNKNFLRPRKSIASKFVKTTNDIAGTQCFEISIDNSNNDFKWTPGQHLYIRVTGRRFLDNHPFSVCNVFDEYNESNSIRLIVRPKKGLTRKLFDKIPDSMSKEVKIFIDGPYGGVDRDIDSFSNVYLLATGSGISAVLPFLVYCAKSMQNQSRSASAINKVRLDWIVRSKEDVKWAESDLAKASQKLIDNGYIEIKIYATHELESASSDASSEEKEPSKDEILPVVEKIAIPFSLQILNFKPHIKDVFKEIKESLGRKNIFVISGSESMKYEVGNAVASLQNAVLFKNSAIKEVYLHTESFDW